ncbi:MAG: class I SAM-dependent DNA methyltransferase [Flavobacteriales bacterium]|nr:class I SAM-dependent DNA methyltransferase [Flavobacteriales bacterium]
MTAERLQKQTSANIQEKANLIWAIADKLVGLYKPHEYGKVILPMCVIKRFEDTLASTKEAVIAKNKELDQRGIAVKKGFLETTAGQKFYNTSPFNFELLLADADNIKDNFESYLSHFSDNVIDVISRMDFYNEIKKLDDDKRLYVVIKEFCTQKAYLGADVISAVDMGYIFEELVRKFSESYNDQAGAHFTARDIIYLMGELLIGDTEQELRDEGIVASIYDMAMGTSQMLACLEERFLEIDPEAEITCFGQELNPQTFGIAKADMLIKGGNADNMRQGDTLGNDQFKDYHFDYIISNPPFGIDWEASEKAVKDECDFGEAGRFAPGLPSKGDGQMLFMLNGVAKLKDDGRMAIIQNGSPLFKGDAGSGESNIRGYLLEKDWLEAIIQLPNDLFYNTGIATYVWVVCKNKSEERAGKVQLIDASKCFEKLRKPLGNKRVEITSSCRDLIMEAYRNFSDWSYTSESNSELKVESKIKDCEDFKFTKVFINRPLRLKYVDLAMPEDTEKLKKEELTLLKNVIALYQKQFKDTTVNDLEFFEALKSADIKITAAQVKKVRQLLGVKDAECPEVYNNPYKPKQDDWAWDSDLADTESIPWKEDIEQYLEENVRPYAPDFYVDEDKNRIGYEIPLTREFYKYVPLEASSAIFDRLKKLEEQEAKLMTKILG